jgi:transposase-like protein
MSELLLATPVRTARRPHCSREERQRIVELSFEEGTSITEIARANGVHPSSLSHWRSLYQAKKSATHQSKNNSSHTTFLPVKLAAQTPVSTAAVGQTIVQMTLPSGATLRIESSALDVACISALLVGMRG